MPVCFFVPGLLGSELGTGPNGGTPLWIHYPRLVIGEVGAMRLAPDGVSPGPPDGQPCLPGAPLHAYYATASTLLERQLAGAGYQVRLWGYDWRMRTREAGVRLAADVRQYSTNADPATIVAHSLGGLVARAAWAALGETGEQQLVRRIVTMGTPHWGSYGGPAAWSGDSDQIRQLVLLTQAAFVIQIAVTHVPFTSPWSYSGLVALSATWPAIYETLPTLDSPPAVGDPFRAEIYNATNWPSGFRISAEMLAEARDVFQAWLRSPASTPPSWVLTTVAGTGQPTFSSVDYPSALGSIRALGQRTDGDGTVTIDSALVNDSAQFTIGAAHADLPYALAVSEDLKRLVLDPRVAPGPPPPRGDSPLRLPPLLSGPPLSSRPTALHDC